MELIALIKEIAGLGALGLFLALFVLLYLKERKAHDLTRDKYVQTALAVKSLFHKVIGTMKIIGDENSTDFEDTKHRLDKIEESLEKLAKEE